MEINIASFLETDCV